MTFKLESVEFSSCLSCGKAPILWDLPITWSPIFSVTSTALIDIPPELSTDERLLSVLGDLREIVALVNCHAIMKSRLDGNIFQAAMSSVRYRLLFLLEDEDVRGSTCECLCLGMLAFLTTTLAIPGRRVSYPYFADRVRGANWNEDIAASSTTCYVHMWLLLVCAMTVLHVDGEDQEWLRRLWLRIWMPDMKWNALQRRISDIAWLPKIHDRSGWEVFVALSAQTDGSEQLGQALGGLESKS